MLVSLVVDEKTTVHYGSGEFYLLFFQEMDFAVCSKSFMTRRSHALNVSILISNLKIEGP
jgi:hypothetical protein